MGTKEYRITRVESGRIALERVEEDGSPVEITLESSRSVHCYTDAPFTFEVGSISVGTTESGLGPGMLQLGLAIVVDAGALPGFRVDLGEQFAREFLLGLKLGVRETHTFDATQVREWVDSNTNWS